MSVGQPNSQLRSRHKISVSVLPHFHPCSGRKVAILISLRVLSVSHWILPAPEPSAFFVPKARSLAPAGDFVVFLQPCRVRITADSRPHDRFGFPIQLLKCCGQRTRGDQIVARHCIGIVIPKPAILVEKRSWVPLERVFKLLGLLFSRLYHMGLERGEQVPLILVAKRGKYPVIPV